MIRASAEQRFALYYAVLFGSIGAMLPFAALWMSEIGISPAMIGVIVSAPSVVMLVTTIALGRWADTLRDRRLAIIAANWVVLLSQLLLFLSTGQWMVFWVWLVAGVVMYAKMPITDASALSVTRKRGTDYARVRVFGSVGFVALLTLAGYAYEHFGIGVFVSVLLVANVLRLLAAYYLPVMPKSDKTSADDQSAAPSSLYQPGIILTLLGAAFINASHAMVYTYGILLWTQQGLSESVASQAIGMGVVVEVALMWWYKSLTDDVSARACLLIAALCGVIRWSLLAVEPSLPVLFAAQALHGITFGIMFLSCANFISRRVPEEAAARGQSLLATLSTACMALATFACGLVFESWGSQLYWVMGGMCAMAMLLIASSYRYPFAE